MPHNNLRLTVGTSEVCPQLSQQLRILAKTHPIGGEGWSILHWGPQTGFSPLGVYMCMCVDFPYLAINGFSGSSSRLAQNMSINILGGPSYSAI